MPVLFSLKHINLRDGAGHCSGATSHLAACFSREIWQHCVTFGKNLIRIYKTIEVHDTGFARVVLISSSS